MTLVLVEIPLGERLRVVTIAYATDLWLAEIGMTRSPRTIDTYRRLLYKLATAYPHIDVDELTATQLRRFLDTQSREIRGGARKEDSTLAQNVSVLNNWMDWLSNEGIVKRNPTRRNGLRILHRPRLAPPEENDRVVTVTTDQVVQMLATADESGAWNKRLALNALAYLGPRRHAIAQARIGDYDAATRTLPFLEKGHKTIRKPVPGPLALLLDAAIAAGIYGTPLDPDAYLVPGNAEQRRKGERDDRVIWRLVREVAAAAGVKAHVHALRAAFAVYYLEQNPGDLVALKDLMGHRMIETTMVYLRRLNRARSMETVRGLDWGLASEASQRAAKPSEAKPATEKEGFEPSMEAFTPITP
jgi:site-specific recombinase XerC